MRPFSSEMRRFARLYYKAIGTPLALSLQEALARGDWDYLASRRVDPRAYTSYDDYRRDSLAAALLRKCKDLPTTFDKRARALESWVAGEVACTKTNIRLAPYLEGFSHPSCNTDVFRHLVGIREIVRRVLGSLPDLNDLVGRHGPGATFSDKSVRSTVPDKMNSVPSMTHGCSVLLPQWEQTAWGRACLNPEHTRRDPVKSRGNRFTTAPKDAEKDRPIAAEPSINVFYQLAIGSLIRSRLKRWGIDLDKGQEVHRRVAREASISGAFATLDLSNASDTVARDLVRFLLPQPWYALLDAVRSPFTHLTMGDGSKRWVMLEKFSSMGNGFTFELESLIFFAICRYITDLNGGGQVLVYGDDIIVRNDLANDVTACLSFLGFTLNKEKSFSAGPFRESCGGDFFNGVDVRPYFMKELPCEPQQLIAAANAVRRVSWAFKGPLDLRPAWFTLIDQIPSGVRSCRGPEGLGDIVLHDEEEFWSIRVRSQTRYVKIYRPARYRKVPFRLFDPDVVFACALYGVPWGGGAVIPRDAVSGYKVGWSVIWGLSQEPILGSPVRSFMLRASTAFDFIGPRLTRSTRGLGNKPL